VLFCNERAKTITKRREKNKERENLRVTLRKVFFAVIALALIGIIGKAYTDLNGNPIKLWLIRGKIEQYLSSTYPNTQFTYQSSSYNFKFNTYGGRVTAHTIPPVSFYVNQNRDNSFEDNFLAIKLSAQSTESITSVVKTVVADANVSTTVEWDKGAQDVNEQTVYTKELNAHVSLNIRWTGQELGNEDFIATTKAIRDALASEEYGHIRSFFFSYNAHGESLVLSISPDELHLSTEALLSRISHFHEGKGGPATIKPYYTQSMRLSIQAHDELKPLINTVVPGAYCRVNVRWDRNAVHIPEDANYDKNLDVKVLLFMDWLHSGDYDEDYYIATIASLLKLLKEEGYHHISQLELLCEFSGKSSMALLLTEEDMSATTDKLRSQIIRDHYR